MSHSPSVRRVVFALIATVVTATATAAQSVQYRSPAGVEYRSQPDTGAIARAESALVADPRNIDRIIKLGIAQSGARQFRETIATFNRGLAIEPNNALLLRWRGHRYLSVRNDRPDVLTRAAVHSTIYGIWITRHRYARGHRFRPRVDLHSSTTHLSRLSELAAQGLALMSLMRGPGCGRRCALVRIQLSGEAYTIASSLRGESSPTIVSHRHRSIQCDSSYGV